MEDVKTIVYVEFDDLKCGETFSSGGCRFIKVGFHLGLAGSKIQWLES